MAWSAIVAGLILGLFMAISVGPTLFAIIGYSLNHSYKTGLAFVLGVSVSDIIFVTLANIATPWLQVMEHYEKPVAIGGGSILLILGLVGLIRKYKPKRPSSKIMVLTKGHYVKIWLSGFLMNTLNPGVILNWLAAVAITAAQTTGYRILFFGACLTLVLGVDTLKVLLADGIGKRLTLRKVMYLQRISSFFLFIIGAGIIAITLLNIPITPKEPDAAKHLPAINNPVR
jgi:threonine/homoserine/homoserine lactone efflux protein